jgi:hypothetical protein
LDALLRMGVPAISVGDVNQTRSRLDRTRAK